MPAPRFSILILTYSKPDLLWTRLGEIDRHLAARPELPSFEVVVCDNGSPNREASLIVASASLKARYLIRTLRLDPNRGFSQGFNHAMDEAEGEVWICLSDDVEIAGDFLTPINQVMQTREALLVCHRIVDWPAGWNVFAGKMIRYPMGYFLAAHSQIWAELGRFDGRFAPYDYEDVDLGMEAQAADISVIAMPDLPLFHQGAGTIGFNPDRMEQTVRMRALFAKKWDLINEPERP